MSNTPAFPYYCILTGKRASENTLKPATSLASCLNNLISLYRTLLCLNCSVAVGLKDFLHFLFKSCRAEPENN